MKFWYLFNTNKLLRKAKHHIEVIEKLNDQYRDMAVEQNRLIADSKKHINQQAGIIEEQAETITELRIRLEKSEAKNGQVSE